MTGRPDILTCPHAEATTLAWLYGEGPDEHAEHVAHCADCTHVVEMHSEVLAAVGPILDDVPEVADLPGSVVDDQPVPTPANRTWLFGAVAAVAVLAAAVLLVLGLNPGADRAVDTPVVEVVEAPAAPDVPDLVPRAPAPEIERPQAPEVAMAPAPEVAPVPERVVLEPAPVVRDTGEDQLAELLLDDALTHDDPIDDGLDGLLDEFDALEASLTTL